MTASDPSADTNISHTADAHAFIAVYVMADEPNGAVRVGMTTDLGRHAREHRPGAPRRLGVVDDCRRLVWFEAHDRLATAVTREQAIQSWRPEWIVSLIEAENPQWLDLAATWFGSSEDDALLI